MSYKVETIKTFDRQSKRLVKKYPSFKKDLTAFANRLSENPDQGTSLGKNCFKVRLAISSKNKGKSGGARIITHVQIVDDTVFLLSIYDKSAKSSLNEGELDSLLSEIED